MLNYTEEVEKIGSVFVCFTGVYRKRLCKEGETQGLQIIYFNQHGILDIDSCNQQRHYFW